MLFLDEQTNFLEYKKNIGSIKFCACVDMFFADCVSGEAKRKLIPREATGVC